MLKIATVAAASLFALVVGLVVYVYVTTPVPTPQQLGIAQRSTITFSDGTPLVTLGAQNRSYVPLSAVPAGVRDAVLAAEDRSFYSESGISLRGIARAVYRDVRGGGPLEGGSTITQQYAKNAYLTQDRTFTRKFREIVLAVKLDHTYSKDQILEFYLNTIYFGRGAFGIETASETYFGTPVSHLTPVQGALLAGLIRGPSLYDPALHPMAAATRFHEVTAAMVTAHHLAAADANGPLPATKALVDGGTGAALRPDLAYLRDAVVQELAANGISEAAVARNGLIVKTTIDRKAQDAAWAAATTTMKGTPKDLQIGISAIDPTSGAVRASVGGLTYKPSGTGADVTDNEFYSSVLPGSTFKTVVLAGALAKGWSLSSVYSGRSPEELPGTGYTGAHALTNDQGDPPYGDLTLSTALASSVNTVFVPLGMQVGDQQVAKLAHSMGISPRTALDPQPSLAIGTSPVRPIDVTSVYATVADGGVANAEHLVDSVVDAHRHTLYRAHPDRSRVLGADVSAATTSALQGVIQSGTGTTAALQGRPAAGKTGTTATSAMFAGFTPQLAASVAIFYEDNRPLTGIAGLAEVYGATLPATAFRTFMDGALAGQPAQQFPAAPAVGHAVSDVCPAPYGTTFVKIPGGPDCTTSAPSPTVSGSPTPTSSPSPSRKATPTHRGEAPTPGASTAVVTPPSPTTTPSPNAPDSSPPPGPSSAAPQPSSSAASPPPPSPTA